MAVKKKSFLKKNLVRILMLAPTIFSLVNNIIQLIEEEFRLAEKNLVKIILCFFIFLSLFTSALICLNAVLFIYLISLSLSWLSSLLIILSLHIVLLFVLLLMM